MRFRSLYALLGLCLGLHVHAQFADDFSDGDFTNDPVWQGDATVFTVNASQQLQLNNTVAATSHLRSSNEMSALDDMEWRMRVKFTFAPSSSNFGRVYLVSDQADLTTALNGYYLQFGEAGSNDAIELFEQTGTTVGTVCRGTEAQIAGSFDVGVQVKRNGSGAWQLLVDPTGGTNYILQASGLGTAHNVSTTIGVVCTYTLSNADKFNFDDLYAGPQILDTTAPTILSAMASGPSDVEVLFSEPVEELSAETISNYVIVPTAAIFSAIRDGIDPTVVHLSLSTSLANGTAYTLTSTGVQDLAGNIGTGTSATFSYLVPVTANYRDVVINEIMADPSPVVGLPEVEFVELYNASTDRIFDLAGWTFGDGGTPVSLPAYTLAPGAHVVLMANASLPLFPSIPNKIGLTSLPALNNDGDPLELRDNNAFRVDNVTYALSWYQDGIKDDGGWTLEQIDPTSPCSGASNWRASNAPSGGTPGTQNSIYAIVPDNVPPALVAVQVSNSTSLGLVFSEAMDAASFADGTYVITPSIGIGLAFSTGTNTATLNLLEPLVVGTLYTISVNNVKDCPGNSIGMANTATFALPEAIAVGDVVINEVLYDPFGSGSDLVELYNRSNKVLSLAGLQLANVTNSVISIGLVITNDGYLLLPGEYALVCESTANIQSNYPQSHVDRFVETDMPSYNNGSGSVVFLGADGTLLDRFDYDDDLHFSLINNTEGYSLERVDPDRNSDDNTNWQSASDVAGKATPGFQNSQYAKAPTASGDVVIDPAIFSPDNDGHQDVLTIAYTFNEPGFVGNMTIYDVAGREARRLMENVLLGTSGAISWDGLLDSGSLGRIGPYVMVLEVFDLVGNVEHYKRTITLAQRLN